jgi:hypothetical protein
MAAEGLLIDKLLLHRAEKDKGGLTLPGPDFIKKGGKDEKDGNHGQYAGRPSGKRIQCHDTPP